jgi:hypothetical protein
MAAYDPVHEYDCGNVTRSGGRSGSPVSDMHPESAMISISDAWNLL